MHIPVIRVAFVAACRIGLFLNELHCLCIDTNCVFVKLKMKSMSSFLYALTVIILLGCLPLAHAIKCWVCHSDTDPKCADPFDNTTLPIRDCRELRRSFLIEPESPYDELKRKETGKKYIPKLIEARMCRKIRQKIHGNWRTIRDCAFLGSPGEGTGNEHHCLYRKGTYDIYLEYCTCNSKDGCNGAPNLVPRVLSILLSFTFVWILLH